MPISPKCPHCDARETFPDSDAGRTVNCSACGGAIALPAKARPVAAAVVVAKAIPAAVVAAPIVVAKPESQPEFQFDDEEEPKPRKKSKPTVDLDEDDALVRKKPRRKVEDEDDDDSPRRQPAKKGGGKKLLLILGGIAFVLLAGCSGIGIYLYIQADKAVADIQSKLTDTGTRVTTSTTVGTQPGDGRPRVKENVARVDRADTFATVSTKIGLGGDCTIADLEDLKKGFKDPNGADKALFGAILDWYAPWVDKGCGKIYSTADRKFRAVVIFGDSKFDRPADPLMSVQALLTVEEFGTNRSAYRELIAVARDTATDPVARRLGLKPWFQLKPEAGSGTPVVPPVPPQPAGVVKITSEELVAEVLKDRAAASMKYGGKQLEVTGEIKIRSSAGSTLYLKGALDENTMKDVTVAFTMKADERDSARKCQVGDTITLTGVFPATLQLTAPTVPLREGAIKK